LLHATAAGGAWRRLSLLPGGRAAGGRVRVPRPTPARLGVPPGCTRSRRLSLRRACLVRVLPALRQGGRLQRLERREVLQQRETETKR
jgi:hypothetical protein